MSHRIISLVLEHYSRCSFTSFNLGEIYVGYCIGAVVGKDLGVGSVWLLGDSFMKNVYTAFSFDDNTVGFATLA